MYSFEVIEYILKKGKDILDIDVKDNKGITALHDACREGKFKIAELLIENNASVMVIDETGGTPLHYLVTVPLSDNALTMQFRKLLLMCLERGYAINSQDNKGNTILHYVSKTFITLFYN